ncbi:hypothetical protein BB560_004787 [Smittium megazygosporum]|uniref:Uncharacterized protein n=1 Tax=Smittium megazygosporum TaxID=133381 RepID=A0A2T9Z881_9FUNG|nr:hypothetical protein BB560_004787 [Smittium megazygosporum]
MEGKYSKKSHLDRNQTVPVSKRQKICSEKRSPTPHQLNSTKANDSLPNKDTELAKDTDNKREITIDIPPQNINNFSHFWQPKSYARGDKLEGAECEVHFRDWRKQLLDGRFYSCNRYVDYESRLVNKAYLGPIFEDSSILRCFSNVFIDTPTFIRLVNFGNDSYGWEWFVKFRYGTNYSTILDLNNHLIEDKRLVLFKNEAPIILKCLPSGDRYSVPVCQDFVVDTINSVSIRSSAYKYAKLFPDNDRDAFLALISSYAGKYAYGSNHFSFFASMFRYYFSALLANTCTLNVRGYSRVSDNEHMRVTLLQTLANISLARKVTLVNAGYGDKDYVHFLVTCGRSGVPEYRTSVCPRSASACVYDRICIKFDKPVLVIHKSKLSMSRYVPKWPRNHSLIKSYILRYANTVCAVQAMNDAFRFMKIISGLQESHLTKGLVLPISEHYNDYLVEFLCYRRRSFPPYFSFVENQNEFMDILGNSLIGSTVEASIATFIEGALSKRNHDEIDFSRADEILRNVISDLETDSKNGVGLLSTLSGFDLSCLYQVRGSSLVYSLIDKYMHYRYTKTFERLFLPRPTLNSWTYHIRRPFTYEILHQKMELNQFSYEDVQLLEMLNFNKNSKVITNTWSRLPLSKKKSNRNLGINTLKKRWFLSLGNKYSNLQIWYAEPEHSRFEYLDSYKTWSVVQRLSRSSKYQQKSLF